MKWVTPEHVKVDRVGCPCAEGFRHLGYKNDHEDNAAEWIVYDALYAYCKEVTK